MAAAEKCSRHACADGQNKRDDDDGVDNDEEMQPP